ncbi:U1 small nuclear ribonucleoprotein A [Pelomyxa schiedti]|nr:U1 small nuclear ribonucleoprotein A [Pelomyxa schiedti]
MSSAAVSSAAASDVHMGDIPPGQTIYVTNLDTKVNKNEIKLSLYCLFSQFGSILDIVAMKTPRMRGQAFVVFRDLPSATLALRQLQGFPFYDKPLRLAYAKSKSDVVARLDGSYVDRKKTPAPAAPAARKPDEKRAKARPEVHPRLPKTGAAASPNHILFVENLPANVNESMLTMVFQQFPGYKEIRLVPTKEGIAFVEFENEMLAGVAMQALNGFKITHDHAMAISFAKR